MIYINSQKEHWNNEYLKQSFNKPEYDFWLDRYKDIFEKSKDTTIIDLGCGRGNNSLYLVENGFRVISCDISDVAIERVKTYIPEAETMIFDMQDGLPFESESSSIIIADLCLHYFTWNETKKILQDIKRVLKNGGHLLCRVNSTKDTNYGAGQGSKIEENYYEVNGSYKRFFDRTHIEKLFQEWDLKYINEYQMDRYKIPKLLWEVAAVKV